MPLKRFTQNFIFFGMVLLLIATIVKAQSSQVDGDEKENRIIGGEATTVVQYPFMIQIFRDNRFGCSGSLVNAMWVLTAAHCVFPIGGQPERFYVRGGDTFLDGISGVRREIRVIVRHKDYNEANFDMDVAMMKVKIAMIGLNIEPVERIKVPLEDNEIVRAIGWGKTTTNGDVSNQLRTVLTRTISLSQCRQNFLAANSTLKPSDNMVCVFQQGTSPYEGDSGSPLLVQSGLVVKVAGVFSAMQINSPTTWPAIYGNILKFEGFIQNAIRNF